MRTGKKSGGRMNKGRETEKRFTKRDKRRAFEEWKISKRWKGRYGTGRALDGEHDKERCHVK